MNDMRPPRPHHELSFEGMTPWPVPGELTLARIEEDPAARCCQECGRRLQLLLLRWSSWVSHRTEHVSFRDDRSVVRTVNVEFHVPDLAPLFRGDDGRVYSLLPLSVMRRKTLVNFQLRDDAGRAVFLPSLRQNQAITESMLLACADAALDQIEGAAAVGDAGRRDIAAFVHEVVSGDQRRLSAAYRALNHGGAAPAVHDLVARSSMFKAMLDRLADNFVLWVMIPAGAPRRRELTFCCDEPLDLHYRRPGFRNDQYTLGHRLSAWRPSVWCSALGLTATRVRFPVPAAENAASFHFEIDAPKGVEITEASLLAGRPREPAPSFDHVQGGFPTVGLHVIEVPNGSLSRAQIGLQVVTRGWVTASTLSCWAVFGLLLAVALHQADLKRAGDVPVLILVALAGAAAGIVAQSDGRGLAAHLLKWTRALATAAAVLPLVATTYIAFESADASRVPLALWSAAVAAAVIALLLTAVCLVSWRRQRRSVCSPWEQNRSRDDVPDAPADFDAAARSYRYDRPAVRVDSAEGWHTEFHWDDRSERALITALENRRRAFFASVGGQAGLLCDQDDRDDQQDPADSDERVAHAV
jgi:hypothetical protein